MKKIPILILSLTLFSISSFAAHQQSAEEVYSFEDDILSNAEKLEKARQFCLNNDRNIYVIVDDSSFHRMALKKTTLGLGHAVFEFKSGDDLLKALRNKSIASVLVPSTREIVLDNQMPGTFGVKVLAMLKQEALLKWDEGRREVPVILNTDNPVDIDEISQYNFAQISPRKNSKEAIQEVDEKNNSPFTTRTINYGVPSND